VHVDVWRLRARKWIAGVMATFGVFISTIVIGVTFWLSAIRVAANSEQIVRRDC
jgi:CPA1 family monovalent cation:H+ antiporter